MSPASKSKSKDKSSAKALKEQSKTSFMTSSSGPATSGNGLPGSAYNPVSGTFHALEIAPSVSSPSPQNGRFRTIDETIEDHSGSSQGTAVEFDSLSNNDSSSGESEDQKEKGTTTNVPRMESIPGSDGDKREKIRQKNEKKHQRQKEKRAQELHERCNNYLMSRKLDGLAQKLVAMGFAYERATMALIANEGRVEDSVSWILERDDPTEQSPENLDEANLKIDISDELTQLTALATKYKCTKQEVEKAVVAYEGDLVKSESSLKTQKQETAAVPPKTEPAVNPLPSATATELSNKSFHSMQSPAVRAQAVPVSIQQQRRDDRDFNYTKAAAVAAATKAQIELTNRNLQSLRAKPDWGRPPTSGSTPSVSQSLPPLTLQGSVPQAKLEARYQVNGNHVARSTSLQAGTMLKEPIIMMQRPQSKNAMKQSLTIPKVPLGSSPPASSAGFHPNGSTGIDVIKLAAANPGFAQQLRHLSLNGSIQQQDKFQPQSHYRPFGSSPIETGGWGGLWSSSGNPARTPSLASPASLGLFSGSGSSALSGSSDWSTGWLMPECDYTSIDWSLNSAPATPSYMGVGVSRPMVDGLVGFQGRRTHVPESSVPPPPVGSHEWTTFNGDDLFRAPRQFATSPYL